MSVRREPAIKKRLWAVWCLLWVLGLLAGCAAGGQPGVTAEVGTETPAAVVERGAARPTATAEASAGPIEWAVVSGAENLVEHGSWRCAGPTEMTEQGLVVEAGSNWATVLHGQGPRVKVDGDFGLRAQVIVAVGGDQTKGQASVVAVGALPTGQWWEGVRRLEYGLAPGQVTVTFWDGTQSQPALSRAYTVEDLSNRAELEFHRVGDQLLFYADGAEVARMSDPGAFPQDAFYLGANVPPGNRLTVETLQVLAPRGREHEVRIVDPAQAEAPQPEGASLRELAAARDFWIGAAVAPDPLLCEPAYAQVLQREFNVLTTENALKFGPVHPAPDRYDWRATDTIVEFAEANHMQVRGHTLVWHQQLPAWVEKGDWTREELTEVLREHITTVVGRYRGRIAAWDVVNEAIDDDGDLRDTVWLRAIGPEYIELAFRSAHEADPEALLFYNDYSAETMNRKSDAVYALAQELLEKGVPIHGIGLQMHVRLGWAPSLRAVRENMERLGALGLQVQITEMDVRVRDTTIGTLEGQAQVYGDTLQACLEAPNCTALVLWGLTDRHSWIPGFFKGWGDALIFDEAYAPKPAYDALREALAE